MPFYSSFNFIESSSKKQRRTSCLESDDPLMDTDSDNDDSKSTRADSEKGGKHTNHSEIEKRRRDKMNMFIQEIASLVPACANLGRKQDKITVLKHAVMHIRNLRGSSEVQSPNSARPNSLMDRDMTDIFDRVSENCFYLTLSCETGIITNLSANTYQLLGLDQSNMVGRNFFDLLCVEDVDKVREQLFSSVNIHSLDEIDNDLVSSSTSINLNSTESQSQLGFQRNFECNIKFNDAVNNTSHARILCCGFVKSDKNIPKPGNDEVLWTNSEYGPVLLIRAQIIQDASQLESGDCDEFSVCIDLNGLILQVDDDFAMDNSLKIGEQIYYSSLLAPSEKFKFERDLESQKVKHDLELKTRYKFKCKHFDFCVLWKNIFNPLSDKMHSFILIHSGEHKIKK